MWNIQSRDIALYRQGLNPAAGSFRIICQQFENGGNAGLRDDPPASGLPLPFVIFGALKAKFLQIFFERPVRTGVGQHL